VEDKTDDDAKAFGIVLPPSTDSEDDGSTYEVWEEN